MASPPAWHGGLHEPERPGGKLWHRRPRSAAIGPRGDERDIAVDSGSTDPDCAEIRGGRWGWIPLKDAPGNAKKRPLPAPVSRRQCASRNMPADCVEPFFRRSSTLDPGHLRGERTSCSPITCPIARDTGRSRTSWATTSWCIRPRPPGSSAGPRPEPRAGSGGSATSSAGVRSTHAVADHGRGAELALAPAGEAEDVSDAPGCVTETACRPRALVRRLAIAAAHRAHTEPRRRLGDASRSAARTASTAPASSTAAPPPPERIEVAAAAIAVHRAAPQPELSGGCGAAWHDPRIHVGACPVDRCVAEIGGSTTEC